MKIEKGKKLVLRKTKGSSTIEITRHPSPNLENRLLVNSKGKSKKYDNTIILEKDLENWLRYLQQEYDISNIDEDTESSKKNNKKN